MKRDTRPPPTPVPSEGISYRESDEGLRSVMWLITTTACVAVLILVSVWAWNTMPMRIADRVAERLARRIDPHCLRGGFEPEIPSGTTEPR